MSQRPPIAINYAALSDLLSTEADPIARLTITLCWRTGLQRSELHTLNWSQVDLTQGIITLGLRKVPIPADVIPYLQQCYEKRLPGCDAVVVTLRQKKRVTEQFLSQAARSALDRYGMPRVRLCDLRFDYIRRCISAFGQEKAAMLCGLSMSSIRSFCMTTGTEQNNLPACAVSFSDVPVEQLSYDRIEALITQQQGTAAGLLLRLYLQLGLSYRQILDLQWSQVDLSNGYLLLAQKRQPIPADLLALLQERYQGNGEAGASVLLSDATHKPFKTVNHLSKVAKDPLVQAGLFSFGLPRIRACYQEHIQSAQQQQQVLALCEQNGWFFRRQVDKNLNLSPVCSRLLLSKLIQAGELVRLGDRYYVAQQVPKSHHLPEQILSLVDRQGATSRRDIVQEFGVEPRYATYLLNQMLDQGLLVRSQSKQYSRSAAELPEQKKRACILALLEQNGMISRKDAANALHLSIAQAGILLRKLADEGVIMRGMHCRYHLISSAPEQVQTQRLRQLVQERGALAREDISKELQLSARQTDDLIHYLLKTGDMTLTIA